MEDLRSSLYEHLQRMSMRFFTGTRAGEVQSRLVNDVGGVQAVVSETAASMVANVVVIAVTLTAMVMMSWQLTVLTVLLIPVFAVLTRRVGARQRDLAGRIQQTKADMAATVEETLSVSGALLTKTFGRQAEQARRFRGQSRELSALQLRADVTGERSFAVLQMFFAAMPVAVYFLGGVHGGSPETAGTLVAFTALQSRLFLPVGELLHSSVRVRAAAALFERIFEFLDLEPDITDRPGARPMTREQVRGRVTFENVSFRYAPEPGAGATPEGAGHQALCDVDLDIPPGCFAAVVGPSGSGKTTLSYLVSRLYDPTRGSVRIDGVDVRDIRLDHLPRLVGTVTQETYLLHASVADNLRHARPDATAEQIEAAARAAGIHERVLALENGYDTVVGERGHRLSGGEKQRLAIARVLLQDPRIVILDEATSALDTAGERLVQTSLQPLLTGRTTLAIAHRLSTVLAADIIFVLDRGRVAERGTHSELLARGGLYATLYTEQFRDRDEVPAPAASLSRARP
jgi:ATP-binding cassette subfamily B protein